MPKSDLFRDILSVVSRETEITEEDILSGDRRAEVVDARYFLVYELWRRGFRATAISSFIHRSRRTVEIIITRFDERRRGGGWIFDHHLRRIEEILRNKNDF